MHCYRTYVSLEEFLTRWEIFGFGSHNPDATLAITVSTLCLADDTESL